jgi:hypothetical protein
MAHYTWYQIISIYAVGALIGLLIGLNVKE